ncbi:hypothetical protein KZO01_27100 [Kurthia zopfii]|nr:hypothetical protein KZO01_27100 [Kurthia zopfii]
MSVFLENSNNYVIRRLKKELEKFPNPKCASLRQIGCLMKEIWTIWWHNLSYINQVVIKL